jgi:hypothetical protein
MICLKNNDTHVLLVWDFKKHFHTSLVLVLKSKADFWLLCGMYVICTWYIEMDMDLILNLYNLKCPTRQVVS